MILNRKKNQ